MSSPEDLKDVYLDELKDLWSANDRTPNVLKIMTKANDAMSGNRPLAAGSTQIPTLVTHSALPISRRSFMHPVG